MCLAFVFGDSWSWTRMNHFDWHWWPVFHSYAVCYFSYVGNGNKMNSFSSQIRPHLELPEINFTGISYLTKYNSLGPERCTKIDFYNCFLEAFISCKLSNTIQLSPLVCCRAHWYRVRCPTLVWQPPVWRWMFPPSGPGASSHNQILGPPIHSSKLSRLLGVLKSKVEARFSRVGYQNICLWQDFSHSKKVKILWTIK